MNFSLYIAKRYLFSKNKKSAINIITIIATIGVVVSAMVLFILLSGFSGLRTFSYSLLNASDPDIKISKKEGKSFVFGTDLENLLLENTSIKLYSRVVEERVFVQHKSKNVIAQIKGVDASYNNIIQIDSVLNGLWIDPQLSASAVIGNGIAYKLSLNILNYGEALKLTVPKSGKGMINPNSAFNFAKVQVLGTFGGTEEFHNKYIFTGISLAQKLLGFSENQVSSVEIKLVDNLKADEIRDVLQGKLGQTYKVQTREQLNSLFYKVINTENFIGYLIGTLITIIALFNILGSIIMMIVDKKDNLKTLFKLGASLSEVKRIFVFQGFLLTLFGMFLGLVLAIVLVLVQQRYGIFMITQSIPYPVEFRWFNLLVVILTIAILGYLAAKIASSRINKFFLES